MTFRDSKQTKGNAPADSLRGTCRVLVVDDESFNREILQRMLVKQGFQVQVAASGRAALALLEDGPVDLVLLDVIMPDMGGLECLQRIRARHPIDQLPVVMVTADANRERVVAAFRAGANDYVTKPIDRDVTLARITTQIQLRHAMLALRESEERYALAALGANDGLWDWDVGRRQIYFSPRFKSMLGFEPEEIGSTIDEWLQRIHVDECQTFLRLTDRHADHHQSHLELEMRMIHRDGGYRWMLCRGVYLRDEQGHVVRIAGSLTDITKGKVGDPLTGLPNRLLFMDRLNSAWARYQRRPETGFAVIFLDLDNFKRVNDSLGHQAGDQLLTTIAHRIEQCVRKIDRVSRSGSMSTAARLAGDEFTVLLEDVRSEEDVQQVVARLSREIAQPVQLHHQTIVATASIGWAMAEPSMTHAEDVVARADTAMYRAKSMGRNQSCQHPLGASGPEINTLQLEHELREAVAHGALEIGWSPIVELATGATCGYQADLQWRHPRFGLRPAREVAAHLESLRLWDDVRPWLWAQIGRGPGERLAASATMPPRLLVDLCWRRLIDPSQMNPWVEALQSEGLSLARVFFQVELPSDVELSGRVIERIEGLVERGVNLGLTGVGTGHAALIHCFSLPIRFLTLERSLIRSLECGDAAARPVIQTLLALGERKDLITIASGLSPAVRPALREWGCQWGIGAELAVPNSLPAAGRTPPRMDQPAWSPSETLGAS